IVQQRTFQELLSGIKKPRGRRWRFRDGDDFQSGAGVTGCDPGTPARRSLGRRMAMGQETVRGGSGEVRWISGSGRKILVPHAGGMLREDPREPERNRDAGS